MNMSLTGKYNLIVILGPTATGKTKFAALLANRLGGEIISADSRQVYKRMDIGTGKDYADYVVSSVKIPYHLVDIREPGEKYNVFEFQKDFSEVYKGIIQRNGVPILCGGTGMYIEAVTKSYRLISVPVNDKLRTNLKDKTLGELEEILAGYKRLHNKTDTDTIKRAIRSIEIEEYSLHHPELEISTPKIDPVYFGVHVERDIRRARITERLHSRLKEGMIDEVEALLNEGLKAEDLIYYGLEYKFITLYLTGKLEYKDMVQQLNIAIHQFAKRQMTWFRKMEREGCKIHWIDAGGGLETMLKDAIDILSVNKSSDT
jgi:tRNA dimethylallyltransferase